MRCFISMLKMDMKMLFRNKGYLCFLVLLPIISILLLNLPQNVDEDVSKENTYQVHEMQEGDILPFETTSCCLNVKIIDCSKSKSSEAFTKSLVNLGAYEIYRYEYDDLSVDEAREKALELVESNYIGAVIFIGSNFENDILNNNIDNSLRLFKAADEERVDSLENNILIYKNELLSFAKNSKEEYYNNIDKYESKMIKKSSISIKTKDSSTLSVEEKTKKSNLGYSLSIITIAFLFSGVFIAGLIIEERNNSVFTRIKLADVSMAIYEAVKLGIVFISVIIQTLITVIGVKLFVSTDMGVPLVQYTIIILSLGLVFTLISSIFGVIAGSVLDSVYAAFSAWCISCILSGLYFPLDGASEAMKVIGNIMPQKWAMNFASDIITGNSVNYGVFIPIMFSYILIILAIGYMSLKLKRKE